MAVVASPSLICNVFKVVLNTIKPLAAELIASRWASVILGINNPFVVEVISKAAEASGVVVPTLTWVDVVAVSNTAAKIVNVIRQTKVN